MAAVARWRRARRRWRRRCVFAAAWLLAELARGVIFTGFPWVASGYAHVDSPLGGFAPWLGVYGVGAVVAGAGGGLRLQPAAASRAPGSRRAARWSATLALGAVAGRIDYTRPTGSLSVSLLQGNVPQEEKFAARYVPQALAATAAQLAAARGELVVGPETVIPVLPDAARPTRTGRRCSSAFALPGRAALIGLPLGDARAGLHQLGGRHLGRDRGAAGRLLPLRQAPPGAVRRVHPDRLSLVHAS